MEEKTALLCLLMLAFSCWHCKIRHVVCRSDRLDNLLLLTQTNEIIVHLFVIHLIRYPTSFFFLFRFVYVRFIIWCYFSSNISYSSFQHREPGTVWNSFRDSKVSRETRYLRKCLENDAQNIWSSSSGWKWWKKGILAWIFMLSNIIQRQREVVTY